MTKTLAVGAYREADRAAFTAELDPVFLTGLDDLQTLDADLCNQVTALAYKGHTALGAAVMALLPNLGLIANFGVGYDAIDIDAATARGIRVTNTPDVLNDDVADLAVGMMLCQSRRMMQASDWARTGKWAAEGEFPLNRKMSGGTAGILGLGRIGREIADRLTAFKMEIHYFARSEKETPGWRYHADPVSLARAVDFLVVSLVGGKETEKFVSSDIIAALGPQGVLVNISRGSTVDEAALLDALQGGQIAGAALDVFLNEPDIDPRFYALDNVVIQPHQGSGTVETRAAMAKLQRDNINAYLAGRALLTAVN